MSPSRLFSLVIVLTLVGCAKTQQPAPPPAPLTEDAVGHYCGMMVIGHQGPKGQIFLTGGREPLWFSSVRDTLAFTRLPEEPKNIVAIYVHDMGRADWERPDDSAWIDARRALYVVGSRRAGGMGAAELVPFGRREDAEAFARQQGGQVIGYERIPDAEILGSPTATMP